MKLLRAVFVVLSISLLAPTVLATAGDEVEVVVEDDKKEKKKNLLPKVYALLVQLQLAELI